MVGAFGAGRYSRQFLPLNEAAANQPKKVDYGT